MWYFLKTKQTPPVPWQKNLLIFNAIFSRLLFCWTAKLVQNQINIFSEIKVISYYSPRQLKKSKQNWQLCKKPHLIFTKAFKYCCSEKSILPSWHNGEIVGYKAKKYKCNQSKWTVIIPAGLTKLALILRIFMKCMCNFSWQNFTYGSRHTNKTLFDRYTKQFDWNYLPSERTIEGR